MTTLLLTSQVTARLRQGKVYSAVKKRTSHNTVQAKPSIAQPLWFYKTRYQQLAAVGSAINILIFSFIILTPFLPFSINLDVIE